MLQRKGKVRSLRAITPPCLPVRDIGMALLTLLLGNALNPTVVHTAALPGADLQIIKSSIRQAVNSLMPGDSSEHNTRNTRENNNKQNIQQKTSDLLHSIMAGNKKADRTSLFVGFNSYCFSGI
ncbi:hypothetical protein ILYODFUR_013142 [Ilyodon furcidens]|uniref:Uncharacterized protein n=1 Tax=Ilyodon furcidens TaxID=33524 RepID=A0ABV0TVV8_9TELE